MFSILINRVRKYKDIINVNDCKGCIWTKYVFIIFWNFDEAFVSPNDITLHSWCPKGNMSTVLYLFSSATWTC